MPDLGIRLPPWVFDGKALVWPWMKDAGFGVAKSDFIGPLESAATLGVMKNFRIYKPGVENPDFLEVRHAGNAYFGMLGGRIPLGFGDERAVP